MIQVVVSGAAGRMGREIVRLVLAGDGLALAGAVDRAPGAAGQDAAALAGLPPCGVRIAASLAEALPSAGVVIDFTHFEASAAHAEACAAAGIPMVVGATGFTPAARARVAAAAARIPIVLSPNMSVGVNVLFDLVRQVRPRWATPTTSRSSSSTTGGRRTRRAAPPSGSPRWRRRRSAGTRRATSPSRGRG